MKFIADLHIHSKYSRATAKNLDLENLYIAAQLKGITLVGTGDFTHPAWFTEIQEKLIPAGPGLFRLKDDIAMQCDTQIPASCRGEVRFILQCEISNIYKKNSKTRKNHHVIFVPDMDIASRFNAKLDAIGNIKSDGRPILGLDAKHLLEILIECSDEAFLIPAHIWTPWFSILGSKSGFDAFEECFEDLTPHIFAAETGLSSDPPMNWRVSGLDNITLVSNSDCHSPMNLGRNANMFDTELSYFALKTALKTADPAQCLGTLDMYPEEGKYHMDGHRKCGVCLHPADTMKKNNMCPVCGKSLTIGVLYRVEELADRAEGEKPHRAIPFYHLIPLAEILSEIFNVGVKSKKVGLQYQTAIETLGAETDILLTHSPERIDTAGIPLLSEAITRMRNGNVHISPGYDGEYGKITVFTPDERETLMGQASLFIHPRKKKDDHPPRYEALSRYEALPRNEMAEALPHSVPRQSRKHMRYEAEPRNEIENNLNDEQQEAVTHEGTPLLIIAGPGAGKTLTLTHRIAHLIRNRNVLPENILAVTFTNKAAQEMKDRLASLIRSQAGAWEREEYLPFVGTFHALCFQILKEQGSHYAIADEEEHNLLITEAIRQVEQKKIPIHVKPDALTEMIVTAKQNILYPSDNLESVAENADISLLTAVYKTYQFLLNREGLYDYEDLILNVVKLFESDTQIRKAYQNRWQYVFVDEYQDLNQGQYRMIKALASADAELCAIGDPDQSIYGFRGSDVRYFQDFVNDYPASKVIRLTRNYRSVETILQAAYQVIKNHRISPSSHPRIYSDIEGIETLTILNLATEKAEAVAVGKRIEKMVGGTGFHSIDFGKTDETGIKTDKGFSDFAVLYRTNAQAQIFADIFGQAGIPYQIVNREQVYGRKSIAELIAFLKLTEGIGTIRDFQKIVNIAGSGIGKKTFDVFKDWFYGSKFTLSEALSTIKRFPVPGMDSNKQHRLSGLADKISVLKQSLAGKSLKEKLVETLKVFKTFKVLQQDAKTSEIFNSLLSAAEAFGTDTSGFFEMIALQSHDADIYDTRAEKVALMTFHAAKGLEFPVVFITGCEKDYIPFKYSHDKKIDKEIDIDEERRLFYVAMTRAKENLFLTYANQRTVYGKTLQREISPFVADIESRLISLETFQFKKGKKESQFQMGLFK